VERRSTPRAEIISILDCQCDRSSDRAVAYDVSSGGCLLQCADGFVRPGDALAMRWPGGRIMCGTVVWTKALNVGVRFDERLSDPTLYSLVSGELLEASEASAPTSQSRRLVARRSFDPPPGIARLYR
jgi:hypothetical protein